MYTFTAVKNNNPLSELLWIQFPFMELSTKWFNAAALMYTTFNRHACNDVY